MRIFIGLQEIAGYYYSLTKGFESLGIKCTYFDLYGHRFRYNNTHENTLIKFVKYSRSRNKYYNRKRPIRKISWFLIYKSAYFVFFIWAILTHEVFIFGFNSTFYNYRELPFLKLFRKKIIYVFHGSDSRPSYIDGATIWNLKGNKLEKLKLLAIQRKNILIKIERYTDYLVNTPPQSLFHKRKFINAWLLGLPFADKSKVDSRVTEKKHEKTEKIEGNVRILHSPSDTKAKGTDEIVNIIKNLKNKNYPIDFITIKGLPNHRVIEEIKKCDFIIDQVYSDTPMAGFATEAAYFGKPAIVGGYYSKYINNDLDEEFIPPSLFCLPDEIEDSIVRLIEDIHYRKWLGDKARTFVQNYWSPTKIAERFMMLLENNYPETWESDPFDLKYVEGCCINIKDLRSLISDYVSKFGESALLLDEKPKIKERLLKLAAS